MKLRLTVLLGAAFLLGVLAWAQTPATTTPSGGLQPNAESAVSQHSATGKVISLSDTKLVVEVDSGAQMTFTLDSATALMPEVKNLKVGDRVSVNYKSLSSGDLQVASVSLVTTPAPQSSTTTTTMPPPDKTATQPDTPMPAQPDAVTAPEPDTTTQTRPSTPSPSTAPSTSATPPSDSTASAQPESYSTTPAPTTTTDPTDPNATSTSTALPQTASPLPVLLSLVILAALAAFTLRMARREV